MQELVVVEHTKVSREASLGAAACRPTAADPWLQEDQTQPNHLRNQSAVSLREQRSRSPVLRILVDQYAVFRAFDEEEAKTGSDR